MGNETVANEKIESWRNRASQCDTSDKLYRTAKEVVKEIREAGPENFTALELMRVKQVFSEHPKSLGKDFYHEFQPVMDMQTRDKITPIKINYDVRTYTD